MAETKESLDADQENGFNFRENETVELEVEKEQVQTSQELEAIFTKDTESFRCLAQVFMSRSSLLSSPLYYFPPLKDPGIDEAFNYEEPPEEIDNVCIEKYKRISTDLKIMPISRIIKCLPTSTINLRFYGLTDKEMKALSVALMHNTHIQELVLEENFLTPECAYQLGEMLQENDTLKVLNLKECRLGPHGAGMLNDGIFTTQSLMKLDLSHNSLGAEGIKALRTGLQENSTICKLNLSHNNLDEAAAPHLAGIMKENCAVEDLDLSWNMLHTPEAMKTICLEGLIENTRLKSLSLAWNGIASVPAVKVLTKYLRETNNLQFLDLGNNLITGICVKSIRGAISKSTSLLGINLGFNPLTPEEALSLVHLLTLPVKQRLQLEILDMENVYVEREFVPLWKTAEKQGKRIKIGGVLSDYKIHGPNVCRVLFDRARMLAMKPKQKKKRRDFSHFVFSLPEKPMKKNEFQEMIKKFGLKTVDKDLVDEITKNFKYKKNAVDLAKMKETYLELYPDAQPPPNKKKKLKGKKKKEHDKVLIDLDVKEEAETRTIRTKSEEQIEAENYVKRLMEKIETKAMYNKDIEEKGGEGQHEDYLGEGQMEGAGDENVFEGSKNEKDVHFDETNNHEVIISKFNNV